MTDLSRLCSIVQRNCHVADAEFARNYSLCTYLLKMREYYRWEKGLSLTATISREDVGEWVMEREQLWDALEEQEFESIAVGASRYDPFDEITINEQLAPRGLIYSGGVGRFGQPHFFLGKLERIDRFDGLTVYVSSSELARDLTAPPAMAIGKRIFVRRESLRRTLWELADETRWSKRTGPMTHALAHYDFDDDPERAIEQMTDHELDTLVLHEVGEARAGEDLDPRWREMIACITDLRAEMWVRAVRDNLADCLVTLPVLLEREDVASLQFYFANLQGMRKELFPRIVAAYDDWRSGRGLDGLRRLVPEASRHWRQVADGVLEAFSGGPEDLDAIISDFVSQRGVY